MFFQFGERVEDFSVLYEIQDGEIECLGMTQLINDSRGQFRGIRLAPRFSKMLCPEVSEFLFKEADFRIVTFLAGNQLYDI